MDSIAQNITFIKTIYELDRVAKYSKISENVCRYEIIVTNCDPSCTDEYISRYNNENTYFYIPLCHLFQDKYDTAIVCFLDKREDLCIQLTLLQAATVMDYANVCIWEQNYTYCRTLTNQHTTRFIANLRQTGNIQEYIIGFAKSYKKPILLTLTEDEDMHNLNITQHTKYVYAIIGIILIIIYMYVG